MRLHALRLCNFRQHVDTFIEFDRGLTGIIGPNGSGKSTILEAIAWALYGMPAARGTRESIRSHRAAPRATVKVELDFELGGHRYNVVRGLTNAEVYLDGATVPIANTISGVTELLRRRLGMSLEEFFNTYFTGQKELSVMAAMGPSERAQFLSRVLGYEKLRTAQGLVRERRRIIAAEGAGLKAGMPDPEVVARQLADAQQRLTTALERARAAADRRAAAHAVLDDVTPRWEAAQRERERLQKVETDLRVADGEHAALTRELTRLETELSEVARAREELTAIEGELVPLSELVPQLQEMDRLYAEDARRRTVTETERSLADELTRLRERLTRLEPAPALEREAVAELEQRRLDLDAADAELQRVHTEWVRDRQEAETKKAELLRQYQEYRAQREQLVQLGEDGTCPTCARPLGDHYRTVLDLLDSQIETALVDGKYFRARIEQLEAMPPAVKELDDRKRHLADTVAKLERRVAKVQSAVQELAQLQPEIAAKSERHEALRRELQTIPGGYDAARHAELRAAVERMTPLDARCARLRVQIEREPQLGRERARVVAQRDVVDRQRVEFAGVRDEIRFSEQSYTTLRSTYEDAAAELRGAELAAVGAEGEAAGARAAREHAEQGQRELQRGQEKLAALTRDKRLHDELDRAYSDMRTDLNLQLRPEVSELASGFLADLTDGRYSEMELDDQYNIIVLEDGIPKPVISGGEEDIANLVLRLAISQMIAERAGQSFSLLILDEIFGSLDEARRTNVVELLRKLQDRFEQVILITHIEPVREGLDRVIAVRHDAESGSARVEQEGPLATPEYHQEEMLEAGAAD